MTHGINDANDYSDWWGGFRAIPGWDPATGVGTPNFAALAKVVDAYTDRSAVSA